MQKKVTRRRRRRRRLLRRAFRYFLPRLMGLLLMVLLAGALYVVLLPPKSQTTARVTPTFAPRGTWQPPGVELTAADAAVQPTTAQSEGPDQTKAVQAALTAQPTATPALETASIPETASVPEATPPEPDAAQPVQSPEEPVEVTAQPTRPPEPPAEVEPEPRLVSAPTIPPMEAPTPEPTLRAARIRAAGDLMVHALQLDIARQSDGSYDFHPQYALVNEALGNADYTIANLETTLGMYKDMPYSGYPLFNTPVSLLDAVKESGVDFLTLANNHMLDRYFAGLKATADAVEAAGFDHGGSNRTPEEQSALNIVEVNGIRLGFLCYTEHTNGMEVHCNLAAQEYGVNYLRKSNLQNDVKRLRAAGADVVIIVPHWGEEYQRAPTENTRALARRMAAAGADVVLGSHPHVVQPVKFVEAEGEDGETHRTLVAYSLGNFISNMRKRYTDSGIILEFTLRERQDGSFDVEDVACVPIYCWKRDTMIQAVPTLKYYDDAPKGMNSDTRSRMRTTYKELVEVLGEDMPMLAE